MSEKLIFSGIKLKNKTGKKAQFEILIDKLKEDTGTADIEYECCKSKKQVIVIVYFLKFLFLGFENEIKHVLEDIQNEIISFFDSYK